MANQESESYIYVDVGDDTVQTLVTSSPASVDSWIADIERIHRHRLNRLVVGLDVEWRPNFLRGVRNPVALLQLCVGRRCLVFQLIHAPYIPESLHEFLQDQDYTFVGVGVGRDVEQLAAERDLNVARWVDLGVLAAEAYSDGRLRNAGLKGLAKEVLGLDLEKPRHVAVSLWNNRLLSLEQIRYACSDAFVSFELGRVLEAWND